MDTLWVLMCCRCRDGGGGRGGGVCWGSVQHEYLLGREKLSEKRGLCCDDSGRKFAFSVLSQHDCEMLVAQRRL